MGIRLKLGLLVTLGSPLIAFILWYSFSFLPHLSEIREFARRGNESVRTIQGSLYPLLAAAESTDARRIYAMRQAYWSLVYEREPGGTLKWHAGNFLWYVASYIHFDETQIAGIWIECALAQCRSGLSSAARKYFGREPTQLSNRELAELLAVVRSPARYAPGTEAGAMRAKEILVKANLS